MIVSETYMNTDMIHKIKCFPVFICLCLASIRQNYLYKQDKIDEWLPIILTVNLLAPLDDLTRFWLAGILTSAIARVVGA